MHPLATAGQSSALGAWAYLVVFIAAAAGYMGVPVIGTAVITGAAVLASQGELNIAAVLIVAAIGCEIGGLGGFRIGFHWGRQLLEHPGPALEWRKKTVAKGEEVYQKWGRAAVFVTPSIVSGVLDMRFRVFVVWNFFAGTVFAVSVGATAYGAGKVSTGHTDSMSWGMLIGGLVGVALCVVLVMRHYRRHRARDSAPQLPAPGDGSSVPAQGDGSATALPPPAAALPLPEAGSTVHQNNSTVHQNP